MTAVAPSDLADRVLAAGTHAGLTAVGIASATPFTDVADVLHERKADGLSSTMAFTYRNPERSTTPSRILDDAQALVVGAWAYKRSEPSELPDAPRGRIARYAWEDHYGQLRSALDAMAAVLRADDYEARVVLDDNALVDRHAAYRAGIGWYGKNANILLPEHGSWFVLGAVVTNAPLPTNDSPQADGCGPCTRCLQACPTNAIVAPGVIDARRCLAWLVQDGGMFPVEYRKALGDRIYGCDDCQEVCPPNVVVERKTETPVAAPNARSHVSLLELLELSDEELLARHGRWYLAGRDPNIIRRNALIALGNTADSTDTRVVDALRAALHHESPLVRGHAVWALGQLKLASVLDGEMDNEDDSAVLAELATTKAAP